MSNCPPLKFIYTLTNDFDFTPPPLDLLRLIIRGGIEWYGTKNW